MLVHVMPAESFDSGVMGGQMHRYANRNGRYQHILFGLSLYPHNT